MSFIETAYAMGNAAQSGGGGDGLGGMASLLPIVMIFAIIYFLMIRPQQKKVKEHRAMVEALRRGDQVLTQGGIIAKVTKVHDDGVLEVEIAPNVVVKTPRATIAQVMNKTEPAA